MTSSTSPRERSRSRSRRKPFSSSHLPFDLAKPLVILDFETTGGNPFTDRIIQFAVLKTRRFAEDDSDVPTEWESISGFLNPQMQISPKAYAIHGISNEQIEKEVTFRDCAVKFRDFITGSDLAGWNIAGFDYQMLGKEFQRAGIADLGFLVDCRILDLPKVWRKHCRKLMKHVESERVSTREAARLIATCSSVSDKSLEDEVEETNEEPSRSGRGGLAVAYEKVFGKPLTGAHDARADVTAVQNILYVMVKHLGGEAIIQPWQVKLNIR